MNKKIAAVGIGAGALALSAAAMGGIGLANAQDSSQNAQSERQHRGPHGPKGEPVTGEAAEQAKAAAQEALPNGEPKQVFSKPDGGYAVFVKMQSGKKRVVLLDSDFAVQKIVKAKRGPGKPLTGNTERKAEAAATAEVDGTAMRAVQKGNRYYVIVRTDDGGVLVKLNKQFKVLDTEELPERGEGRHHGGPGGPGGPGGFGGPGGPGGSPDAANSPAQTTTA